MKMSACWLVFLILVGCRLSGAEQHESTRTCTDNIKVDNLWISAGDNVTVPCPQLSNLQGDYRIKFNLFKNNELINNYTCKRDHGTVACNSTHKRVDVGLQENTDNRTVIFMLARVNASNHIYRCERTVVFPPPYRTESGLRILVLLGHQCSEEGQCLTKGATLRSPWIWVLVSVSLYSIIITGIAIGIWVKLRKIDSNNDYINTKPKPPRDRRKNRGVQNPFPRHF